MLDLKLLILVSQCLVLGIQLLTRGLKLLDHRVQVVDLSLLLVLGLCILDFLDLVGEPQGGHGLLETRH